MIGSYKYVQGLTNVASVRNTVKVHEDTVYEVLSPPEINSLKTSDSVIVSGSERA